MECLHGNWNFENVLREDLHTFSLEIKYVFIPSLYVTYTYNRCLRLIDKISLWLKKIRKKKKRLERATLFNQALRHQVYCIYASVCGGFDL